MQTENTYCCSVAAYHRNLMPPVGRHAQGTTDAVGRHTRLRGIKPPRDVPAGRRRRPPICFRLTHHATTIGRHAAAWTLMDGWGSCNASSCMVQQGSRQQQLNLAVVRFRVRGARGATCWLPNLQPTASNGVAVAGARRFTAPS
jgi:hypothetical protein